MRRDASFLLSEGHSKVNRYPLYRVWEEARIARHRINAQIATEATLVQNAVASLLDKKAAKQFNRVIKRLTDDE